MQRCDGGSEMENDQKKILVTGGCGYVGSHTVVALLESGYDSVIVDNLSNSKSLVLDRIEAITGRRPCFYQMDLRDRQSCDAVFRGHSISAVIHFAALKAVGESIAQPLRYYENNIDSTLSLCLAMVEHGVKRLIFSSSAVVYGEPATVPIREDFPVVPTNPYGKSKLMIEQILQDVYVADPAWQMVLLRYFNPVGAHESGWIGEDPAGIPSNLMPYISQVAVGRRKRLNVFGNDYPTPDGTGVRDYVHVMDLACGHLAALRYLERLDFSTRFLHGTCGNDKWDPPLVINLGGGRGYSVLEMIQAFEKVSGKTVPYEIVNRRPGDIAVCFADPSRAKELLGWTARRGLADMCVDAWRWQEKNPEGYG